jgi:thiol-disulfide isomerase/thioredoxin
MSILQKIKIYIKGNFFFLQTMVFFSIVYFNADARSFLTQQVLKTGLFAPKISESDAQQLVTSSDIFFRDVEGNTISLKGLEGKVVFINFWATWCPPCVAEMPSIQTLYNEIRDQNIVFLMVDVDNNLKKSKKFFQKKGYDLPLYEPASAIPTNILDGSIPTTLILDQKGRKVLLHKGMGNYADKDFIKYLRDLSK